MHGDPVEFLDAAQAPTDGHDDELVLGARSAPNRNRRVVIGVLAAAAAVGALVVWASLGRHAGTSAAAPAAAPTAAPARASTTSQVAASQASAKASEESGPVSSVIVVPGYARQISTTQNGDLVVRGTPLGVQRALVTEFGDVTRTAVQTIVPAARANAVAAFTSRRITTRSGPFRVQIVITGRGATSGSGALYGAPAQRGSVHSSEETFWAGYRIDVQVSGPTSMQLSNFGGDQNLVDDLLSTS